MPQQINLLNSLPKQSKLYLSRNFIFLILGGYFAFLLVLTAVQSIMLGWQKYSLVVLQKKAEQYQVELEKTTKLAGLNNTIQLENLLQEKQTLLQTLESRKVGTGQCSFLSYYFETLSDSVVPGLWLTKINVDLSHEVMSLSGNTYLATLPIVFIQAIQKRPCFLDKQVGPFELMRSPQPTSTDSKSDKKESPIMEFTLKSTPEAKSK